jgi:hypothetical protein
MNFFLLSLLFLYSCNLKSEDNKIVNDVFPETRPPNFKIIYNQNGGMLNISESVYISADSCSFEKNKYGNTVRVNFMLDSRQIDSLYTKLRENKFNEIETYNKTVYDRGGSTVSVTVGDTVLVKSNSGFSFIQNEWADEYSNISGVTYALAQAEWNKKSRDFIIIVANSLKDKNGYVMFDNNNVFDGKDDRITHPEEITVTLKLVDGTYSMNYNYRGDYVLDTVNIRDRKGIRIFSNHGKLEWEYF